MHRHVPIYVQFFFGVHALELNWIALHNALYLCHQPTLDSRPEYVCLSLCERTRVCICSMGPMNALLQYAFFNDIDFYYCFHCCWATILWHSFFSANRPHLQHQTVCVRPLLVCDYCCGLRNREWISAGLLGVLWVPDTLTGPIWRKMSEPNPISMFPFIESTHTQPIIVQPK